GRGATTTVSCRLTDCAATRYVGLDGTGWTARRLVPILLKCWSFGPRRQRGGGAPLTGGSGAPLSIKSVAEMAAPLRRELAFRYGTRPQTTAAVLLSVPCGECE